MVWSLCWMCGKVEHIPYERMVRPLDPVVRREVPAHVAYEHVCLACRSQP